MEFLILGGGCFWCLDIIFQNLIGVESVIPGYAGGFSKNPTYIEVCTEKNSKIVKIHVRFSIFQKASETPRKLPKSGPTTLHELRERSD